MKKCTVPAGGEKRISSTRAQGTFQWSRKRHRVYAPPVRWKCLHEVRNMIALRAEHYLITTRRDYFREGERERERDVPS